MLFVGDYDLTDFGPWYGDLHSDLDQTIASIEKLRKIPARVWIASHEQGVFETDPGELWDRFLGVIQERDNRLLELLTEPTTREQIIDARILYKKKKEPQAFYDFCEWANMGKHLDRLIRQGRAVGGKTGNTDWFEAVGRFQCRSGGRDPAGMAVAIKNLP